MENKAIKNMEYWKKKNNIPGIEALADAGLTDGRAGSSPFQIATPGSSPNKFLGMAGAVGAAGLFGGGKKEEGPKELLEGTGKTVEKITGFKVSGGDEETAVAGGAGAADGAVAQPVAEDPNSAVTMKKSPLEQEEMMVEEKPQEERKTIAGQNIIKGEGEDEGNFYYDTGGDDQIYLEDPDGIIAKNTSEDGLVGDVDFLFEETEDGYYKVTGVKGESVDPDAPGTPGEPGYEPPVSPEDMIPGGVGGPMEMRSPYKNYKNPQDYKAFNFGNKPTPFNKYKKGKY